MPWNDKYWDIVHQYYWSPAYLGLTSIPKKLVERRNGTISLPEDQVPRGATLYARRTTFDENLTRLMRLEEPLNDFFDLTFAIAPDEVISELLHQSAGIADAGPFISYGKEICHRFGWGEANITMQDGFFASNETILGIELKLGSRTRPDQLLKYMSLLVAEERVGGPRKQLALLFVTPPMESAKLWGQCGLVDGRIDEGFIERVTGMGLNSSVAAQLEDAPEQFASVARRLILAHTTWPELCQKIDSLVVNLDQRNMGEQTVWRLLSGFRSQVAKHEGTGVANPGPTGE